MEITSNTWEKYINTQGAMRKKAAEEMKKFIEKYGLEDRTALIAFAKALVDKYGEGAAAYACELFEEIAIAQGVAVVATPAEVLAYGEVAKAVNGCLKQSPIGALVPSVVERLVKQAAEDTMVQNAKKYGAYFAWIPHGLTCPYCLMIGAIGWQKASSKTVKGKHASHIHGNCDCEFVIDFKGDLQIEGYNPEQLQRDILSKANFENYAGAGADIDDFKSVQTEFNAFLKENGRKSTQGLRNGLNELRREQYQENKEVILMQKRNAYAIRTDEGKK